MRLTQLMVAGCMIAVMHAVPTYAQDSAPNYLRQPASVKQTAMEYDNYLYFAPGEGGTATASDGKAPVAAAEKKAEATSTVPEVTECPCTENASSDRWGFNLRCRDLGEPWTMPQPCALAKRDITLGGWVEAGAFMNQYDTDFNGPIGMRPNKFFNLNQLYGFGERIAKQEACEWDWGGRVDYVFGTDGPMTQTFGDRSWDYGWNSSSLGGQPLYGSAVPQAYADATYGNFKIRAGHFYTPLGYEGVAATGNFFYSHSYVHTYGEPFTNTGVIASQILSEKLTVSGGWLNGWDNGFDNMNHGSMFLGGLNYKLTDCTDITWNFTWGYNGDGTAYRNAPTGNLFAQSLVLKHQITSRWSYVFQTDYAENYDLAGGANAWYGINQYLFYKVCDTWGFGGRMEWFRDDDGVRVVPGNSGNYYEMATGINWKPHANIMVRPELRYDWYQGSVAGGNNPFNNGNATSQLSGGCDVIVTF
jgi:hypothetical protein